MEPVNQIGGSNPSVDLDQLKQASKRLETAFLSELLKSAGVGEPLKSMGGGIGEEQFSSYLRDEYARVISDAGGIGLAEILFQSLSKENQNGQ